MTLGIFLTALPVAYSFSKFAISKRLSSFPNRHTSTWRRQRLPTITMQTDASTSSCPIREDRIELSNGLSMQVLSSAPEKRLFQPNDNKPVLLFLHGSFHAAWCWTEHYFDYFTSKGYTVVAPSWRGTGNVEDEVDEQVVKVANCTSRSRSPVRKATESQLRINRSSQRARITKSASSQLDQHFQGGQHDDDENDDADDQDEVKTLRGELEQSTNRIVELSMQLEQLKFKDEKASRGNLHQNDVILSPIRRDDNGVDDDIAFDDFECFSPVKFHPPRKTSRAVRDGVIGWGDQDNLFPKDFGL